MPKKKIKKRRMTVRRPIISRTSVILIAVIAIVLLALWFFFRPTVCANSISCVKNLSTQIENDAVATFAGRSVTPPQIDLAADLRHPVVLGLEAAGGEKHIYIDLSSQTLYAYQGDTQIMKTFVSTGKWGRTPTGEFNVWLKVRAQRMSGGSGADYYDLPNVPYVMFFANNLVAQSRGFSLHGAYWHNNFGHPMSHGCVNMRQVDAEALYNWADPVVDGNATRATAQNPGTAVTIYGEIPEG